MKTKASNIQKQPDSTFILSLTLDKESIKHGFEHVLSHLQQSYKSRGFRPGKVPLDIIKKEVNQEDILEEAANHLISHAYSEAIESNGLKPIIQPKVKVLNPPLTADKEWRVEITGCEIPPITLAKDLDKKVKAINSTKPTKEDPKEQANNQLDQIIKLLIESSTVTLPPILVEAELSQRLSQLVDQTQQAGLTVQAYLKSKNSSIEQYGENVSKQIVQEWTLNLAVEKIASEQKISIDQKEIEDIMTKNPNLSKNPNLVYYLLQQQKVFDYLKSL